ncbi:MAG: hypothetical protein LC798_13090 [Chloroflexi bacterium]|nr:hypothetical protein [Chloroflexota bacterium]
MSGGAGVLDALTALTAVTMPGACPYCSGPFSATVHAGSCPKVRSIEYHPNGSVKKVEFTEGSPDG